MDKDEIMAEAQEIGSYAISSSPTRTAARCSPPRNPLTRGRLAPVEAAERALPIAELVDRAAAAPPGRV
jgi:adenylyl- and sulfurtransferase ThiI